MRAPIVPAFAGRYSIWMASGRVKKGGQLQALGVTVSTLVHWGYLVWSEKAEVHRGSHTSTMPVNSRTGTQVMWIATLTCAVSKCALLAMGIRPMYGIAMVGSVLVLSQL